MPRDGAITFSDLVEAHWRASDATTKRGATAMVTTAAPRHRLKTLESVRADS